MDERELRLVALAAAKHGVGLAELKAYSVNPTWVCIVLASGQKFAYAVGDLEVEAAPVVAPAKKPSHTRKR